MIRRLACVATLAAALGVAAPTAAQAEGGANWYLGGHLLEAGKTAPVTIHGKLTFYLYSYATRFSCNMKAAGTIEGGEGGGLGEIESVEFKGCRTEVAGTEIAHPPFCPKRSKFALEAAGLPWPEHLTETVQDTIEGVVLNGSCSGAEFAELGSGALSPSLPASGLELAGAEEGNVLRGTGPGILVQGHLSIVGPTGQRQVAAALSSPGV